MIKILVTGANGQLGNEIKSLSAEFSEKYRFIFTDRDELDITIPEKVKMFFENNKVDYVINCAAYTAVDKAEEEREKANELNHKAVEILAKECENNKIKLIHISTDYVFDGKNYKPYTEEEKTNPLNHYGYTKTKGEEAFLKSKVKGIIIRTSWLYSTFGNNFIKTMLNLSRLKNEINVVVDQIGSPTYARDLGKAILEILPNINKMNSGIYHYTNEGVCSWFDFAKAIFEIYGKNIKINPILAKDYPTKANRPYYSVLDKTKIKKEFKIKIPYWKESLKECLKKIKDEKYY